MNNNTFFFLKMLSFGSLFLLFSANTAIAQVQKGKAAVYPASMNGMKLAFGEKLDPNQFTAAHETFAPGTSLKITRADNGASVTVRVNDRGPYMMGYVVSLSQAAGNALGIVAGKDPVVTVTPLNKETPKPAEPAKTTPPAQPTAADAFNNADADADGLYAVSSKKVTPEGFAVQVGIFTSHEIALNQLHILQKNGVANILVSVFSKNKVRQYKILVGPYKSKAEADKQKEVLVKKGFKCFVVAVQ